MKFPKVTKKTLLITGVLLIGGITGVAALNAPSSGGADTSPLTTEVDRQGQQLSNHEARITNTENDVKDLQNKTGTAPSSTKVDVPSVSTTTPVITSTPTSPSQSLAPAAVTVTNSNQIVGGQHDGYCYLTYSDGTHDYVKATITTVANGNSSSSESNCNDFIGQTK